MLSKLKHLFNRNPFGPRFTPPKIEGYINPFIDIEVMCRGESLLHESLAMIIHTRLKDYNLFNNVTDGAQVEVTLILPTGATMKFPMIVKKLDQKLYRQRGDGLPNGLPGASR